MKAVKLFFLSLFLALNVGCTALDYIRPLLLPKPSPPPKVGVPLADATTKLWMIGIVGGALVILCAWKLRPLTFPVAAGTTALAGVVVLRTLLLDMLMIIGVGLVILLTVLFYLWRGKRLIHTLVMSIEHSTGDAKSLVSAFSSVHGTEKHINNELKKRNLLARSKKNEEETSV